MLHAGSLPSDIERRAPKPPRGRRSQQKGGIGGFAVGDAKPCVRSTNPASTKRPESQAVDQHRKPTASCRPLSVPVAKAPSRCFEVTIVKSSCEIAAVSCQRKPTAVGGSHIVLVQAVTLSSPLPSLSGRTGRDGVGGGLTGRTDVSMFVMSIRSSPLAGAGQDG